MKTGYLAGGINGLADGDCRDWRERVKAECPGVHWLDPLRRDYRGREDKAVAEIVDGDLADLARSDFVLAMAERASWGTAMEVYHFAAVLKRPVLAVCGGAVSPWLRRHSLAVPPTLGSFMHTLPPSDDRADLRSVTPSGFARAVFEQNRPMPLIQDVA